ncbi:hypothetical protein ACOMHN_011922 [Nucella lapillus]
MIVVRSQSDTEVRPQSDTEVRPQSDTEVRPQSDTEVRPQSDTEARSPVTFCLTVHLLTSTPWRLTQERKKKSKLSHIDS